MPVRLVVHPISRHGNLMGGMRLWAAMILTATFVVGVLACGGETLVSPSDAGGHCRGVESPDADPCVNHWVQLEGDLSTCGFLPNGVVPIDACIALCNNPNASVCGYRDAEVFCQSGKCERDAASE